MTSPLQKAEIEQLLAAMTRHEKLAQLQVTFRMTPEENAELARGGIGALFWPMGAKAANELQRIAVEETRNGIPLLIGLDVIHGHRTIFPVPLAQACSFDPSVTETDGRVSAAEAASNGVNWAYSPMVDVSRDPRWGRVCEGFGESPLLGQAFGAAKVRGFQGERLSGRGTLAACAKHFVGYGAAEGGRDYNSVDISERRLRDSYLKPFRAVVDAGCGSVMASFNTINGRPVHANRALLTGVLKDEWGFAGPVVGDADGVRNLVPHGVASDHGDARRTSFGAGLDIEMCNDFAFEPLDADLAGLDDARLDDAVRRVLGLKFELGLFDEPYVDESDEILEPPAEHLAAAQEVAERCAVLLTNDGTLPLSPTARIMLTGPYATSTDHLGAWVQGTGIAASDLATTLAGALPGCTIDVEQGCGLLDPNDTTGIAGAADSAREHDLVIVAVGEPSDLTGEASSRADLRLPGAQEALIGAIADTGVPFVVVLVTGRPMVTAAWVDRANAVLLAWHLGTRGAEALAALLTGTANPAGRLAMAFPRSVGQLPWSHDGENTGRPPGRGGSMEPLVFDFELTGPANIQEHFTSKYRDLELGPQFNFGHGLSYSSFEHGQPELRRDELSLAELDGGALVCVSTTVTNTSERDGDEVVQVYVRDLVASLAQPVRRLAAFARVTVPAGRSRTIELTFGREALEFWLDDRFVVEPGTFEVLVGPRPDELTSLTLTITD